MTLELLPLGWQAGKADVRILLDGHGPLQLEQRHIVDQSLAVEGWVDDHVPDADLEVGEAGVVYCLSEIVVSEPDLQISGEKTV